MHFPRPQHFLTGVGVPLFSLKSRNSCGCGDFTDLQLFGDFCERIHLDMIYLLPLNDTGLNPSPYSALSAFALNPIFISLRELPLSVKNLQAITEFQNSQKELKRLSYQKTYLFKEEILKDYFFQRQNEILNSQDYQDFLSNNDWVISYAIFKFLKNSFGQKGWQSWVELAKSGLAKPDLANLFQEAPLLQKLDDTSLLIEILTQRDAKNHQKFFHSNQQVLSFYVWEQALAAGQLQQASRYLEAKKIYLKGDIPIMMEEDSVDVWLNPDLFVMNLRAGAPPDQFSKLGQHWGFPVYNWPQHEKTSLHWWKQRLNVANRFYHAYRIDHVLGFFRVWCMNEKLSSGILGQFFPTYSLKKQDFYQKGFNDATLHWLSVGHVSGDEVKSAMGTSTLPEFFEQVNQEDLYTLKNVYDEKAIFQIEELPLREFLLKCFHSRCLLPSEEGYVFAWYFEEAPSFFTLPQWQKDALYELAYFVKQQNFSLHREQGRRLLTEMKNSTPMLVCAEDLGAVEDYVPEVLGELQILSLKVQRWYRDFDLTPAPFYKMQDYPRNSFSMSSVHDSSTIRGWCKERSDDFDYFCRSFGIEQDSLELSPENAQKIIELNLQSNSILAIVFIQDILALDKKYHNVDSLDERINVPGLVADTNWSYQLPVNLEELLGDGNLIELCAKLVLHRKKRAMV